MQYFLCKYSVYVICKVASKRQKTRDCQNYKAELNLY
jgi:hypothetical protein